MKLNLDKPKKKNGVFVGKIHNDNHSIKIKISNAKFVNVNNIPGSGTLLKIWIPKDSESTDIINNIDEQILEQIIEKNSQWFDNSLSEEQIKQFFRVSLNSMNFTMSILMLNTKQPLIITSDNNIADSLEDIDFTETLLDLEIEAQGLFFFQKKCGIRWILRKIIVKKNIEESSDDWIDRKLIEEQWTSELTEFGDLIEKDIINLEKKKERLREFKNNILSKFDIAKTENINIEWNKILKDISIKISKYHDGTLII